MPGMWRREIRFSVEQSLAMKQVHIFELETERQSSVWKHPSSLTPTKQVLTKSAAKI